MKKIFHRGIEMTEVQFDEKRNEILYIHMDGEQEIIPIKKKKGRLYVKISVYGKYVKFDLIELEIEDGKNIHQLLFGYSRHVEGCAHERWNIIYHTTPNRGLCTKCGTPVLLDISNMELTRFNRADFIHYLRMISCSLILEGRALTISNGGLPVEEIELLIQSDHVIDLMGLSSMARSIGQLIEEQE